MKSRMTEGHTQQEEKEGERDTLNLLIHFPQQLGLWQAKARSQELQPRSPTGELRTQVLGVACAISQVF